MKKTIVLLSALTMITAFVGCGSSEVGSSSEAESTTVAEMTETTTAITTKIETATTTNSPEDFELGMPFKLGNMSADMPTNLLYYEEELDSGTMAYYWRSNEWIIQIYNEPILNSDTDAEYLLTLDIAFGKKEDYEKNFSTIDGIGCLVVKTKANNQIGYTIALNGQCYSIIFTCTNTSDIENIVKPIVDSIKFDKTKATTKTDDNVSLAKTTYKETTTVLSTTSTNKVKTTVADEKNSESITYAVGKDILPGEYIFNPYSSDTTPYVLVKTTNDDNAKIIGIFSDFDSQIYLTLEYGQYVTILDAKMERVTYETVGKNTGKGCFRVGIDIPAGKYRITADDEDYSSYCISSDSFVKSFSITKGDFISFNDEYDLTLHDGEYLYLDNANLEAMIGN